MSGFQATGVLFSAIAVYWLAVVVLGTPTARDSVDIASMIMGIILAARLFPDAIDRFRRGGSQAGWKLLLGNVAYLLGWVFFCAWTYVTRAEDRPLWMVESPLNGFFKYWILGGIILSYFGTSEPSTFMPPHRVYYISVGVVVGVLVGIWIGRFFLPAAV